MVVTEYTPTPDCKKCGRKLQYVPYKGWVDETELKTCDMNGGKDHVYV